MTEVIRVIPRAFLSIVFLGLVLLGQVASAQEFKCIALAQSQVDTVFNQALATVSTLADSATEAYRRGEWRPDGGFRSSFYKQAGSSLRTIRHLLRSSDLRCVNASTAICTTKITTKDELLMQFDLIFSVSFPPGLEALRSLRMRERAKFQRTLRALPGAYGVCGK
jgi:hypothetical protein